MGHLEKEEPALSFGLQLNPLLAKAVEHMVQQVRKSQYRVEDLQTCRLQRHQEVTRRLGQVSERTSTC